MELGWFEDILALAETDSMTSAARHRHVSQPAFSRRIQSIEAWMGIELLDRTMRPPQLTPAILGQLEDIRAVISQVGGIRSVIKAKSAFNFEIRLAVQQSIVAGPLPPLLRAFASEEAPVAFDLQAGNREECCTRLMTRQAAIMIAYETHRVPLCEASAQLEKILIGEDILVPVCTPMLLEEIEDGARPLPLIVYPQDIFFGAVLAQSILPVLAAERELRVVCKTSLVSGALDLALAGVGIAYVPCQLARDLADPSRLVCPPFAMTSLRVVGMRLRKPHAYAEEAFWQQLKMAGNVGATESGSECRAEDAA